MKRLNPEKLKVEFRNGTTYTKPIIGRKYTLTHSDITAQLFLTIGLTYAWDKVNSTRDEVLGKWISMNNQYFFNAYCYVGGEKGKASAAKRYEIFVKELPLALEAMRYGDRVLFETHPILDQSPIWIYFYSIYPEYNRVEYWGEFKDYK